MRPSAIMMRGHRRANPELACLIARSGDDTALLRAAHGDRLATQVRIAPLLHRRVESIHVDMDDLAVSHFGSVLVLMRRHVQIILRIRCFGSFLRSPAEFGLQDRLPVLRKSYLVRARQPASTMGLRSAGSLRTRPSGTAQSRSGRPNKTASLALQKDQKAVAIAPVQWLANGRKGLTLAVSRRKKIGRPP